MAGQGNKIIATDFNTIQAKINLALGIGTGDYGYGQVVTSTQVSLENKIEASQWNALRNDLLKARQHQTGLNESGNLALPTTSATIKEADRSAYNNFADVITTNRLITPPASQGSLATLSTINRTTPWNSTVSQTITCTFSSVDAARYFFNAGSNLKFSASFKDYTTDGSLLVNQSWETLLTNMGIISVSANTTTKTGSGTEQNIGYYNLTSTNQLVFSKSVEASNPSYVPNQYQLYARLGTSAAQLIFTPTFSYTGGPVGPGTGVVPEPANGTLTSILQTYYATGSNVAVAPPTVTAGALTGGVPTPPVPVISYAVTPASLTVNEGSAAVFNVTGTNIPNGTYYWTIGNNTTSNADFSTNSGSFTITSNTGSFSVTATGDLTTEGSETFFVTIRSGSINGPILADSVDSLVTINDTSLTPPAPTLALSPTTFAYSSVVNNVPSTQRVTFTSTNGAVTVDSVSTVGATSNSVVTIDYTGATGSPSTGAPFTVNGTKYIDVSYYLTSGTSGSATLSASTTDGSKAATLSWSAIPSYAISPATSSVNEGSSLTFNVTTTSVTNGTVLNWAINTNTGDFGTSSGTVTINSNTGTFTVTPTADSTTEGAETFSVSIYTGSISGTPVATSSTVTINDTSTTPPPPPTYTLTPASSSVNEGSSLTFNVGGTNIVDGTYYWTVTNTGDFGTSSGAFTITSNSGSFNVSPTADSSTEGSESFTASIRSGSTSGTVLQTSSSVTINDTSTTPPEPDPEIPGVTLSVIDWFKGTPPFTSYGQKAMYLSNSSGLNLSYTFGAPGLTYDSVSSTNAMSGTSFNALGTYVAFTGPHSSTTGFVTVSYPGYQSRFLSVTIPANSKYAPYTVSNGFVQEFGQSAGVAASVVAFYAGNGTFYVTHDPGVIRYQLYRAAEAGGVSFWTNYLVSNGLTTSSQAFLDAFGSAPETFTGPKTSYQPGTGYNTFSDRP
jgi:hypothetical protein